MSITEPATENTKTPAASPVSIVCMAAGFLSMFLLPILLAPAAIIAGFVGIAIGQRKNDTGNCVIGMVFAGIGLLVMCVALRG